MSISLRTISLPDFGMPTVEPLLTPEVYAQRQANLKTAMRQKGLDALVVYADREHNANLTWLCGYDPRFEEAAVIFGLNDSPALLVGNEGWGYAELCPSPMAPMLANAHRLRRWSSHARPDLRQTSKPQRSELPCLQMSATDRLLPAPAMETTAAARLGFLRGSFREKIWGLSQS